MTRLERWREEARTPPGAETIAERQSSGWKLVALEWEREIPAGETASVPLTVEIPYGLRIGSDCRHLEADPGETEVLILAMDLIVRDRKLSEVAEELNRAGHVTRAGRSWNAASVFNLLPRLIEAGPQIFGSEAWAERKKHLVKAV